MAHDEQSQRRAPDAVLVVGVLAAGNEALELAVSLMEAAHGPVRTASEAAPFSWSRYYAAEMGPDLTRQFFAFERAIDPGLLRQIKADTGRLERAHARAGRRIFNLDPGYLTLSGLVVASTKDASYRVYLGDGIYAQPMLVYANGKFQPLDWTYPDYRDPVHLALFEAVRRDGCERGVLRSRQDEGKPGEKGG
jgi:hypothetical protein